MARRETLFAEPAVTAESLPGGGMILRSPQKLAPYPRSIGEMLEGKTGIAGPKGLPADVASKMTAALKKVFDSKEFKEFMSNRGFGTVWGDAAQFETFMDKGDAQMGVAMKAAGLSKA